MTGSIVGNLHIVMNADGSRLRAGFDAARRSTRNFSTNAQRDLDRTTRSVDRLRRASSRPIFAGGFVAASRSMQTMNQRAEFLQTSMLALTAVFGGFSAAITGNALMRYADSFTEIGNRIRVVTDSTAELNAVQEQLFDIAQRSRTAFHENVILYGRMAIAGRQLGTSQADLLRITETIQKAFLVGGSTTQEASSSAIQLSQGIASNRLGGDELRSVLENQALGQLLADQISDGDIGKFREMAEEGELTARVIMGAFLNASGAIDEAFTQIRPTISQSFVVLDNALMAYIGASDQAAGSSELFAKAVVSIAENLDVIIPVLSAAGAGFIAAFAGPKLAAIAANTTAVTRNAFAMQAATKAALTHARAEAAAAATQQAAAVAAQRVAQSNLASASSQVAYASATGQATAATAAATRARNALAAANAQLVVTNRAAVASQATLTAATTASTTVIGRLAAASLALVGGPVGAGLIAIAGGYYLISRAAGEAERATREHEQALDDLKAQMDIVAGASERQQEDLREEITLRLNAARAIYEEVRAETRRMAVAAAQMERSSPGSPVVQSLNQRVIALDEETRVASERLADFQMLLFGFDRAMEEGGPTGLADTLDEASDAAQRLAERLADMRLNTLAAGLSEVDRQTVSTALSFGIAKDAIEAFIRAAQSGDLSGVDGDILSIRGALRVQEAYATAAKVLEDLRTPLEQAAEYQQRLNAAVEQGALTVDQAGEAYRRYVDGLDFGAIDEASSAVSGFAKDALRDTDNIGAAFERLAERIADIAWQELVDPIIRDVFRGGVGAFGGGGGAGTLLSGIGSIFGSLFHEGGVARRGGPGRMVPAGVFDSAPRFHSGRGGRILPNEVPAILEEGEAVLTERQQSGLMNLLSGVGGSTVINQNITVNGTIGAAEITQAIQQGNQAVLSQVPGVSVNSVTNRNRVAPGSLG